MVAERFHKTTADPRLERLRAYLSDWADWTRKYRERGGYASSVPYLSSMIPSVSDSFGQPLDDYQTVNVVAMRIIDASLSDLNTHFANGRALIEWRYLQASAPKPRAEAAGAAVFRSGRFPGVSVEQLDELCDGAERALLSIVCRRNLVL